MGFVRLLGVMATGGGRSGGLSVGGRLDGSSKSKSLGMGSSGDLSFGEDSVKKTKQQRPCNELLQKPTVRTRDVCIKKAKEAISI